MALVRVTIDSRNKLCTVLVASVVCFLILAFFVIIY
jgi:hypothetical protein